MGSLLANPLWASLTTLHAAIALGGDRLRRYPADVAPFLAVPDPGPLADDELAALVGDDTVLLVGPTPEVPRGWRLESLGEILQMVCARPIEPLAGPPIIALGGAHRPVVLALTALVYPHYFRPRTMDLGRYAGVVDGERLAAMVGERMGFPGHRELSAMCAHPDHAGRGLARHLLAYATNRLFEEGATPFLHVSPTNTRAIRLYEQNGYVTRAAIAFSSLQRAPD